MYRRMTVPRYRTPPSVPARVCAVAALIIAAAGVQSSSDAIADSPGPAPVVQSDSGGRVVGVTR